MSAAGDERRARLGDRGCKRAQEIADAAPELTPAMRDVLAILLRRPSKKRLESDAA